MRGNGPRAKAVFACSAQGFWREYDLPAQLTGTQLLVNRHFHLKPLAQLLGAFPSLGIVLVDRHRARLFDLRLGELTERMDFFHPLTRRGRGDGFGGYDAGHAERRVADEARQHFKFIAEFLKDALGKGDKDKGMFENWILGCQDIHWSQFEPQLHPYAKQKLLGRFTAEVAHVSNEEIRSHAEKIFADAQERRCQEAVRETLNQARHQRPRRHRLAPRAQLAGAGRSADLAGRAKATTLRPSSAPAAATSTPTWSASVRFAGRQTREVVDVGEAILPWVIRHDIELFYVKDDPEFDKVGNIAALLRFRSEQNSKQPALDRRRPAESLRQPPRPAGGPLPRTGQRLILRASQYLKGHDFQSRRKSRRENNRRGAPFLALFARSGIPRSRIPRHRATVTSNLARETKLPHHGQGGGGTASGGPC